MDSTTLANWFKVKTALEETGKTNSAIYKKAVAITKNKLNPNTNLLSRSARAAE